MRSNDSFFGFWPLSRSSDRKVLDHYHKLACAAATIQAHVRSRREKGTLQFAREEYCRRLVAIRLGALFRGRKAKMMYKELKQIRKDRFVSALKIQCAFRCHMARKRVNRLRERRW